MVVQSNLYQDYDGDGYPDARGISGYQSLPFLQGYTQQRDAALSSIYEIENHNLVEKIVYQLRGFRLIEGNWQPIDAKDPLRYALMNEEGIASIIPLVTSHVDKLHILSDIEKEDIYRMCRQTCQAMIPLLVKNWREFGIKRPEYLDVIFTIINNAVFNSLTRAFHGGERKHRETIMKMVEQFVQRDQEKKRPTFSLAGLFRKGED